AALIGMVWLGGGEPPSEPGVGALSPKKQAAKPPEALPTPAPTPAQSVASAPEPEPASTPARLVEVSVAAIPDDAEILLDGKVVGIGNYSTTSKASSEPQLLEVRAPNYISKTQDIAFDRSRALTISLQRVKRSSAPRSAGKSEPATETVTSVLDGPTRKRQPRSLDEDNPFAR